MLHSIGEKPGKGTYTCISCSNWTVKLKSSKDPLPTCGVCGSGQKVKYFKIG